MRILLLSAYDAPSHQRWREGLTVVFPEHDWTVQTLPPRHFNWRLRGNSLSWAFGSREIMTCSYDLLIATSMVDLSALRGFVPSLAVIPTLVYFHENQFDYPQSGKQFPSVEPRLLNLYTALAADRVVFNSSYNRDTFLKGANELLKRMPDFVPSGIVDKISGSSQIIPVPLDSKWFSSLKKPDLNQPLTLVWNHRWEYDKAPERLMGALLLVREAGVDFRIHVLGQRFRNAPIVFEEMRSQLSEQIGEWGYVEDIETYRTLLRESHIAISTALHDFQGLAVLDAVAAGCLPMVPDRLAYPEFIPADFRYPTFSSEPELEQQALAKCLIKTNQAFQNGNLPKPPDIRRLEWSHQKPFYQEAMGKCLDSKSNMP